MPPPLTCLVIAASVFLSKQGEQYGAGCSVTNPSQNNTNSEFNNYFILPGIDLVQISEMWVNSELWLV